MAIMETARPDGKAAALAPTGAWCPRQPDRADQPVVCQHTRLDARQADNALITTIAFAGEPARVVGKLAGAAAVSIPEHENGAEDR